MNKLQSLDEADEAAARTQAHEATVARPGARDVTAARPDAHEALGLRTVSMAPAPALDAPASQARPAGASGHGDIGKAACADKPPSLHEAVFSSLEQYFLDLEGTPASCIYEMVIRAVERPMLEVVMRKAQGNQLRASEMLGINRNTLRKKLQHHGML